MRPPKVDPLAAVMFLLMILSSGLTMAGGPVEGHPDLIIEELMVDPGMDSYAITVVVTNGGSAPSSGVMSSLTAEEDISGGDYYLISDFSIPRLNPGDRFNVTKRWVPLTTGYHRINCVLDVEREGFEIFRYNNIEVEEAFIPEMIEVVPSMDGERDPDVIGSFFSGVDLMLEIGASLPGVDNIDHIDHVRIEIDGQGGFARLNPDGYFSASFNVGNYGPGDHVLTVNASVSGMPLPSVTKKVRVFSLPSWLNASLTSKINFNRSLEAYDLTGFLDVPTCSFLPEIVGLSGLQELFLFDGPADLMVEGYVMLDGSTTLDLRGDMRVRYGEDLRSVPFSIRSFLPGPDGPVSIGLHASSPVEFDMGTLRFDPVSLLDLPANGTATFPIEHVIEGNISLDGTLELSRGKAPITNMDISMEMGSGSSSSLTMRDIGPDLPILSLDSRITWRTSHVLEGEASSWTSSGDIEWEIDHVMLDMGIFIGDTGTDRNISMRGGEYDMEWEGSGAGWGMAFIKGTSGTVSRITYREGDTEREVRSNNLYKSDPNLEFFNGSDPLIVWVETSSYSTDIITRARSRRLMYSYPEDGAKGVFIDGRNVTKDDNMDSQPSMAASPDGKKVALVWTRDRDGDPMTTYDTDITMSLFNGSSWSPPEKISDGNGSSEPSVTYARSGDLWVAWEEGNGTLSTRYMDGSGLSGIKRIEGPVGCRLRSPALEVGHGGHPVLSYIVVTEDGRGNMYPAIRRGDRARDSLWDKERKVGEPMPWVQSISLRSNGSGTFILWKGEKDRLWASFGNISDPMDEWAKPVDLLNRMVPVRSCDFIVDDEDRFLIAGVDLGSEDLPATPYYLSRMGEAVSIISMNASGSGPGDTIDLEMRIRNTGLFPEGEVLATFLATVRDPKTGNYSDVHLNSVPITFSEMGEVVVWERFHTVLQYEIGLSLIVTSTTSDGCEGTSSRFLSISAFPDLKANYIGAVGEVNPGENITVRLDLENGGNAPTGTRTVRLFGYELPPPVAFEGNIMEPLFFHGAVSGELLHETTISLDRGKTDRLEFEVQVKAGRTRIWSVIEPFPWDGTSSTSRVLEVRSGSRLSVLCPDDHLTIENGENVTLPALVSFSDWITEMTLDIRDMEVSLPEGMMAVGGGSTVGITITNDTGELVWSEDVPVDALLPEGGLELPTSLLGAGEYRIFLSQALSAMSGTYSGTDLVELSILDESRSDIDVDTTILKDPIRGRFVRANLTLTGNRTIRSILVTTYDGMPEDDMVISETVVLGMVGGETRTVELELPVEEGYYLLSFEVTCPDPLAVNGYGGRTLIGSTQRGMFVEDPPEPERPGRDISTGEDLLPALTISIVMIGSILALSLPLRSKKNGDENH